MLETMDSRGVLWLRAIFAPEPSTAPGYPPSVQVVDGEIMGAAWRAIAIVPDACGRFPRARGGELGLDEGFGLARAICETPRRAALLAVVDVPGQAFGRREEAAGLHVSLAAAVDAYATQRRAGRPVFALLVGRAISGAFLAHGLQAGWIGALDDANVEVHVMSASSVARVTRTTPQDVARIAAIVPATARDISTFAQFGAIDQRFTVRDANAPTFDDGAEIRAALQAARAAGLGARSPRERLDVPAARASRRHARGVRESISAWWNA